MILYYGIDYFIHRLWGKRRLIRGMKIRIAGCVRKSRQRFLYTALQLSQDNWYHNSKTFSSALLISMKKPQNIGFVSCINCLLLFVNRLSIIFKILSVKICNPLKLIREPFNLNFCLLVPYGQRRHSYPLFRNKDFARVQISLLAHK